MKPLIPLLSLLSILLFGCSRKPSTANITPEKPASAPTHSVAFSKVVMNAITPTNLTNGSEPTVTFTNTPIGTNLGILSITPFFNVFTNVGGQIDNRYDILVTNTIAGHHYGMLVHNNYLPTTGPLTESNGWFFHDQFTATTNTYVDQEFAAQTILQRYYWPVDITNP